MELVKHETCSQYVKRRLSEGWRIILQRGNYLILSSPDGNILRPVDLRNDVETLRPSANGDVIQLAPYGNGTNWECVDEAISDEDDTTVRVGALGYDLYALPNPSLSGTINSVTVYCRAKGQGSRVWCGLKTRNTIYWGTLNELPVSFQTFSYSRNTNPNTENAWTWGEIDALQIGVKLEKIVYTPQCTQVYVEVDYTPAPPYTPENKSANMGSKMVAAGLI